MQGYAVVLDTCVLYPMYLRDILLRLAEANTYRPLWTEDILGELQTNLAEVIGDDAAARIIALMREHFPDAMVSGHDALVAAMTNDEKDRHVLAAAVRANAAAIITYNRSDFPPESTEPFDIEVIHPDEFLANQWDLAPSFVEEVIDAQLAGYKNPPRTRAELAERMVASDCHSFAGLLSEP